MLHNTPQLVEYDTSTSVHASGQENWLLLETEMLRMVETYVREKGWSWFHVGGKGLCFI